MYSLFCSYNEYTLCLNDIELITQPCPIVLTDEIDSALDSEKVRNLSRVLARLTQEEEIQILNITHKQEIIV